jgi:hypothetical protein
VNVTEYIPPFYLEPISEFVLRVHPGKLILTMHSIEGVAGGGYGTPIIDFDRTGTGAPIQIVPKVGANALSVYRDLTIPETTPGHPCLTWETNTYDGEISYQADTCKVEFLTDTTWVDPPIYTSGAGNEKHIFQLGTYTASAGETGAISSQLRGNVFYTHSHVWIEN